MTKSGGYYAVKNLQELKLAFGGVCNHNGCTCKIDLQFAHRLPTKVSGMGRGSYIRLKDVRENPVNYVLLCVKHHIEYDVRKGFENIAIFPNGY